MTDLSLPTAASDRTLTLRRLIRAPRTAVWAAWTDPARLPLWWGPRGFTCRTHEIDLRPGGVWRFDMIAPDGTVFPNRHRFTRLDAPGAIDYLLDDDGTGAHHFDAHVRFREVDGGTEVTLTMIFPDAATRAEVEAFGAVGYGYTTLDCLAEAALGAGYLSVTALVDAPPDRVKQAMRADPFWNTGNVTLLDHGPGTRVVFEQQAAAGAAADHQAGLARCGAAFDALTQRLAR